MTAKKGSSFEREICKQLSLWWSNNTNEDIFWRTSGSGARAKIRSKQNKNTFGQYGDIQATNPIGQPLINVCSIELKRGYSKSTFGDLLDKPSKAAKQQYELFIEQAITDSHNAKSPYWWLITKRDRRDAIIFIPFFFYKLLKQNEPSFKGFATWGIFSFITNNQTLKVYMTKLDEFLSNVKPEYIKRIEAENKFVLEAEDTIKCPNCEEETLVKKGGKWVCGHCHYKEER